MGVLLFREPPACGFQKEVQQQDRILGLFYIRTKTRSEPPKKKNLDHGLVASARARLAGPQALLHAAAQVGGHVGQAAPHLPGELLPEAVGQDEEVAHLLAQKLLAVQMTHRELLLSFLCKGKPKANHHIYIYIYIYHIVC